MIVTSTEIKTYLVYNWWKFLLLTLIVLIGWTIAINEIITPNENQRIVVSAINVNLDKDLLEEDGLIYMKTYDNQDIRDVFVEKTFIDGIEFHEFISTRSLPGTDLIILPVTSISENTASDLFLPLNESSVLEYFGNDWVYYYEDDVLYGIGLTIDQYDTTFSSYINSEVVGEYYVFFNGYSRNVGDWNEDSLSNEEAAIEFVRWLINEN